MEKWIDINCDIGEEERVGALVTPREDALLALVTSVNIACGYHAGDHNSMAALVRAAGARGVGVGAHPGLPDRKGFGRRAMDLTADEVRYLTLTQIGALAAIAHDAGVRVAHVKPHGALYHMAESNELIADAIAAAIQSAAPDAIVIGLAGGMLVQRAAKTGLAATHEVFADRGYQVDGALIPRGQPGALTDNPDKAVGRAMLLLETGVDVTICVHGDGPNAPAVATALLKALDEKGLARRRLGT